MNIYENYIPKTFDELTFNKEMKGLVEGLMKNFPHLVIVGQKGSGVTTIFNLILKEIYGENYNKDLKYKEKEYKANNELRKVSIWENSNLMRFDPTESSNNDYRVFQNIIKSYIKTNYLDNKKFKLVIFENANFITENGQNVLKSYLERNIKYRFIFLVNNLDNLSQDIISRCHILNIPSPKNEDIKRLMNKIIKDEEIKISKQKIEKIIEISNRDIKRALWMLKLETTKKLDWEINIERTIRLILYNPQVTMYFKQNRNDIIYILSNGVPYNNIFEKMLSELLSLTDYKYHNDIIQLTSEYNNKTEEGIHPILHIEAFLVKVMKLF